MAGQGRFSVGKLAYPAHGQNVCSEDWLPVGWLAACGYPQTLAIVE